MSVESLSGTLKGKRGLLRFWRPIHATLIEKRLEIRRTKDSTIDHEISLEASDKIDIVPNTDELQFTIKQSSGVSHLFLAESKEDAINWIICLRDSIYEATGLSMKNFEILSVLGRGSLAKVMLVRNKDTKETFALKTYQKRQLIAEKKAYQVIAEKKILVKAKFPFIVDLQFTFQTHSKFYFGLEYLPGGELYYHLDKQTNFTRFDIKLYLAEMSLALAHVHKLGIIYRDLKPENIMIDHEGHIKLTDFHDSKDLSSMSCSATSSFIGSLEYLAPEVILRCSYGIEIDWWALGIIAYEMVTNTTPFFNSNQEKMMHAIVHLSPDLNVIDDEQMRSFIEMLLIKDPKKRGRFVSIKDHPYFSDINWEKVLNKEYKPNYVPLITDPLKHENFDVQFTQEEPMDSYCEAVPSYFADFDYAKENKIDYD